MKMPALKPWFVGGVIAALLLLLMGAQTYRYVQSYLSASQSVAHTREVLAALEMAASAVREVENEQRAYVNTGETVFLSQRHYELSQIRAALSKLNRLTADDPEQHSRSSQLSLAMLERLSLLDGGATAYRNGDLPVRSGALASDAQFDVGALLAPPIDDMQRQERALLKQHSEQADSHASNARVFAALLVSGALVAVVLLYAWAIRGTRQKRIRVPVSYARGVSFGSGGKWRLH